MSCVYCFLELWGRHASQDNALTCARCVCILRLIAFVTLELFSSRARWLQSCVYCFHRGYHFYREALGRPRSPQAVTLIDESWASLAFPTPSLLSTGPGQPINNSSIPSARTDLLTPAEVPPWPKKVAPERPPPTAPGLGPTLFGNPHITRAV